MTLRPTCACTPIPCMFMVASTEPSPKPISANAPNSPGKEPAVVAAPTATSPPATISAHTRSTTALWNRTASRPASTLPTPARMGTPARIIASPPSEKLNWSWMAGIRVISAAKANPWQKNAVLTATRLTFIAAPRRRSRAAPNTAPRVGRR